MTEPRDDAGPASEAASVPASEHAARPTPRYRDIAIGLAGALLLVVVLVATAPFWAPLLPWAASMPRDDAELAAGIEGLAAAQQQSRQQAQQEEATTNAALQRLDRRIGALEARPALSPGDIADIREQVAKMSSATADLATRLAAIDKAVHAQAATTTDLATRVETVDKAVHSQATSDTMDTGLVLVLLQIRGAVEVGRPFAAEYEALVALARARPDIAAAAVPLAEPAKAGVAGRAVLAKRLRELAGAVAAAKAPPAAAGWTDAALARLRGLVRIRRIDGAGQESGPAAAVNAAELALAGGDLAAAVAALDKLEGAPAEAAHPWLRMAKDRLAVEAALRRIEALLSARLGGAATTPADAASPR